MQRRDPMSGYEARSSVVLNGIAWNHSRGYPPLVATAQRYEELHRGVRIRWDKRTLHEFGHMELSDLTSRYDLIVVDHPWAGEAVQSGSVFDWYELTSLELLANVEAHSVGASFRSYVFGGKCIAIPIDAASPAASMRSDLLERAGVSTPTTWSALLGLARKGLAIVPGFHADMFLNYIMLCAAHDVEIWSSREEIAKRDVMLTAMEMLKELGSLMPRDFYEWNPIGIAERMTSTDEFAYNAFAYTYQNYARAGFVRKPLCYDRMVVLDDGTQLRGMIGGTGIAVSKQCRFLDTAVDYSLFTASESVQKGIYFLAGGQPAHIAAWTDETTNQLSSGFFLRNIEGQKAAIVRPRYSGYVALQGKAGLVIQRAVKGDISCAAAVRAINRSYQSSRQE